MLHTDDCDKFNNSNNVNESDSSSENDDYNFDITKNVNTMMNPMMVVFKSIWIKHLYQNPMIKQLV